VLKTEDALVRASLRERGEEVVEEGVEIWSTGGGKYSPAAAGACSVSDMAANGVVPRVVGLGG
jgi:hypothetical protein